MDKTMVVSLVVLMGALIYFVFENKSLQHAIDTAVADTVLVDKIVYVDPPPIVIDSIPAVIGLRKALQSNAKEMQRLRDAYIELESLYAEALKDTTGGISVPVATLDTGLVRWFDREGKMVPTTDSIHSEYYFPPVNSFLNTRIKIGEVPTKIVMFEVTKTITKPRSLLWDIGIFLAGYGANELKKEIQKK